MVAMGVEERTLEVRVILGKVSFWAVREATRASFSFWVGPGGRAGCRTGLAMGGGETRAGGAAAEG